MTKVTARAARKKILLRARHAPKRRYVATTATRVVIPLAVRKRLRLPGRKKAARPVVRRIVLMSVRAEPTTMEAVATALRRKAVQAVPTTVATAAAPSALPGVIPAAAAVLPETVAATAVPEVAVEVVAVVVAINRCINI